MNDLIERIARALHATEYPDGSYEGFVAHTPDPAKFRRQAQAALDEMMKDAESCGVCGCAVYKDLPTRS
jgi:hypothetical protein